MKEICPMSPGREAEELRLNLGLLALPLPHTKKNTKKTTKNRKDLEDCSCI